MDKTEGEKERGGRNISKSQLAQEDEGFVQKIRVKGEIIDVAS